MQIGFYIFCFVLVILQTLLSRTNDMIKTKRWIQGYYGHLSARL